MINYLLLDFGSKQFIFFLLENKPAPPDILLISRPEESPPILSPFNDKLAALRFDKKHRSRLLSVFQLRRRGELSMQGTTWSGMGERVQQRPGFSWEPLETVMAISDELMRK